MQVARFCAGDAVRWMDGDREHHGVLQCIEGQRATILSDEGRVARVLVADLSLASHEPSGIFDIVRL